MAKKKFSESEDEKSQRLGEMNKMAEHAWNQLEDSESDLPVEPKPSNKKVSVGRGASSDSKHQHRKFDKFK